MATINDTISEARANLQREIASTPALRKDLSELQAQLACLVEPWQARQRKMLRDRIDEIHARIHFLESGEAAVSLDAKISPFVNAYKRERTTAYGSSSARIRSSPSMESTSASSSSSMTTSMPSATTSTSSSSIMAAGPGAVGGGARRKRSLWEVQGGGKMQDVVDEMRENLDPRQFQNRAVSPVFDCGVCGQPLRVKMFESTLICFGCGLETAFIDTTPAHTAFHDETNRDRRRYEYDRAVHFNTKLAHLQGKESLEVPQHVIDLIIAELYRGGTRASTLDRIKHADIRAILKRLNKDHPGVKKYYENTAQIRYRITGIPCMRLREDQEDRCRGMFVTLQPVFEELRTKMLPGRKNFLNYSFTLYKILQVIGVATDRDQHTLLKGEEKIKQQDLIFKAICERLGWPWTPTPPL